MSLFTSFRLFARGVGQERERSALGIDIGSSSIKVVQLAKNDDGSVKLETYGVLPLVSVSHEGGGTVHIPPEKIAAALKDLLVSANVSTKNSGISLPFSSSLVTVVTVPHLDDEQLANLMPLEARKYIPVPLSEVGLDWQRISPDTSPPTDKEKVLLFAIHKNAIQDYQIIVERAGLDATFYELEIFSILRSSIGVKKEPILLMDIGAGYTKLYIAEEGRIALTRKLNVGGSELSSNLSRALGISFDKAEEMKRAESLSSLKKGKVADEVRNFYERLVSDAEKIRYIYETETTRKVTDCVLSGGASLVDHLPGFASGRLSIPVRRASPWNGILTPPALNELLEESGPEFAVAIGIALRKIQSME